MCDFEMPFSFDEWTIGPKLYSWILKLIPGDGVILELGSGEGSGLLSKHFKVFSVENFKEYMIYGTNYIYAPCPEGSNWYDPQLIKDRIPDKYDCLLIDGPRGGENRLGILDNLSLFNLDDPVVFVDDINRDHELRIFNEIIGKTRRNSIIIKDEYGEIKKKFGIICDTI